MSCIQSTAPVLDGGCAVSRNTPAGEYPSTLGMTHYWRLDELSPIQNAEVLVHGAEGSKYVAGTQTGPAIWTFDLGHPRSGIMNVASGRGEQIRIHGGTVTTPFGIQDVSDQLQALFPRRPLFDPAEGDRCGD